MASPQGDGKTIEVVAEQALVRFSSATAAADKNLRAAGFGGHVLSELESVGWTLVSLPTGTPVASGLSQWRAAAGVLAAEPNHVYRTHRTPNDPLVSQQYALSQVNAFAAWEFETGFSNLVTVAVIDTGIDGTHPDLKNKLTGVSQFFDPENNAFQSPNNPPTPACDHATHVSGVAAASADNGVGIAGMSWGAKLISLKVFNNNDCNADCSDTGAGIGCGTTDTAIIKAINYAAGLQGGAATGDIVVNMSVGEPNACPAAVQTAVTNAVAAGVVLTAAAGNDGGNVQSPGNCAGVIPVGATDTSGNVASFSSRGAVLAANGLVAPGVGVLTTNVGGGYVGASGTSFSSPMVAGAAALILSAKPALTPGQVQSILRGGAVTIGPSALNSTSGIGTRGATSGAGQLDLFRSLRLAARGTLADFAGDQTAIAVPNPFHPVNGNVLLSVPTAVRGTNLKIRVYSMSGQLLRELPQASQEWDGKNDDGHPVASGSYIFAVSTDQGQARGRVTVIR